MPRPNRCAVLLFTAVVAAAVLLINDPCPAAADIVGEAFGRSITKDEFDYYLKTATLLTRSGEKDRSQEAIRQEAWQNLIYRNEAESLGITVPRREIESEMKRLFGQKNVEFGTPAFTRWVETQFGEPAEVFERRVEDLLMINKFMELKTNVEVVVTEKDILDKFCRQYNSFESEYIWFEDTDAAEKFAAKVRRDPKLWWDTYQEEQKEGQKSASWINGMSLEALIDLWDIPEDDAYRILKHDPGDFIVAKFHYGNAVFRLLHKKMADMSRLTDQKKNHYRTVLKQTKKRDNVKKYFEDLLDKASYKDYVAQERRVNKIDMLKEKSVVVLETNQGNIELKLFPEVAPKTCDNFVGLVEKGYYNGTIFHRVIKDFMIQGGDPTGTGRGGESLWGGKFEDECAENVTFDRPGLLAMANAGPNTNGSQFFITTQETPHLNMKHTIFGEVTSGYDVVEKIENVRTDAQKKPEQEQKIIKAYVK